MTIDERLDKLSLEDLVGQVLCYDIYDSDDPKEVEKIIRRIKPGGIFITGMSPEKIKLYTDMVNKYAKVPVIVSSDVENGPETAIKDTGYIPHPMAWGACDDPVLLEEAGKITGSICRNNGIHWTYGPIVDINYNFRNTDTNIRAISDNPEHVYKIASAFARGLEYNDNMISCAKHFPGGGTDERNSHFVTSINHFSKEEWLKTYGMIYKKFIDDGCCSIMVGHSCLPSCQPDEIDEFFGAPPAVLSKNLMTDLLKGELGFDGCIVSDAMSMIGVAARVKRLDYLAVDYLKAGGDVILFPEPNDYDVIIKAVNDGDLSIDRLKDAARRMLKLKEKARLFVDQIQVEKTKVNVNELKEVAQKIADKSIKIVRDYNNILPLQLPDKARILLLNVLEPHFHRSPTGTEFDALRFELESYGYTVDTMINPKHKAVKEVMDKYDAVLLNCKMSSKDYHGSTLRIGWNNIMVMWRAYVLQHPKFIFISFGDPYKLYDMPYLKEYINAFSFTDETQKAVAKVITGRIKAEGKNPVAFEGFFEREV